MIRRQLVVALAIALVFPAAGGLAQRQPKLPVVGVLVTHAPVTDRWFDPVRDSLLKLGYEDGRSMTLRIVSAEGKLERLPVLARELVDDRVDVIITTNELSARAAKAATSDVPIVMMGLGFDPVHAGLVANLNHPGGNITGVYNKPLGIDAKRLQLLKEAMPDLSRVAVFRDPAFGDGVLSDLRRAAKTLALRLEVVEVRGGENLEGAFRSARKAKAEAAVVVWSPIFDADSQRMASLALDYKMPIVAANPVYAFISYSTDFRDGPGRLAYYVDRVLNGAKPSDLPVEEISTTRLLVDLPTARKFGVTVPESILVRADEVIR